MDRLNFFIESLEIEESDAIKEETLLEEVDEWDSIGLLTIISAADDELDITLSPTDLEEAKTVKDILDLLN